MADLLLVVDFDGTVYRGDAPVRRYAELVSAGLAPGDRAALLARFERYLELGVRSAEECADTVEAAALRESHDGWGAAVHLAQRVYGVPNEVVERAFADTRTHMAEQACELEAVTAVIETLRSLGRARPGGHRVRRVLATNSPLPGLAELLARLGAADVFDELVGGLGKPDGLRRRLAAALGPVPPPRERRPGNGWRLFSLGDHYRNEIEPAVEIGGSAGYIDRFGRRDGPATAVAAVAEELLPAVLDWAADPRASAEATAAARRAHAARLAAVRAACGPGASATGPADPGAPGPGARAAATGPEPAPARGTRAPAGAPRDAAPAPAPAGANPHG